MWLGGAKGSVCEECEHVGRGLKKTKLCALQEEGPRGAEGLAPTDETAREVTEPETHRLVDERVIKAWKERRDRGASEVDVAWVVTRRVREPVNAVLCRLKARNPLPARAALGTKHAVRMHHPKGCEGAHQHEQGRDRTAKSRAPSGPVHPAACDPTLKRKVAEHDAEISQRSELLPAPRRRAAHHREVER
jgi:hypothetical protein